MGTEYGVVRWADEHGHRYGVFTISRDEHRIVCKTLRKRGRRILRNSPPRSR